MISPVAIPTAQRCKAALPALIALQDGASVLIRPALPSDSARLQRMFYRLSPTTTYRWCFVPAPSHARWAQTLANMANVDYHNHYAMVASYAGEIIGIARYDYNPIGQHAEFGIVIEDAWQARGLGKLLLSQLITEARRQHIASFTAIILGENRPALRLVSSLFDKLAIHWHSGECQVSASLDTFKPPTRALPVISWQRRSF